MGELNAELIDGERLLTTATRAPGHASSVSRIFGVHGLPGGSASRSTRTAAHSPGARIGWGLKRGSTDCSRTEWRRRHGRRQIDRVFVGSDRITRTATYATRSGPSRSPRAHPSASPSTSSRRYRRSTPPSGRDIPIEERPAEEITEGFGRRTAPPGVKVYAPAFDVTPASLVTSIITEVGVIEQPDTRKIEDALRRGGVSF